MRFGAWGPLAMLVSFGMASAAAFSCGGGGNDQGLPWWGLGGEAGSHDNGDESAAGGNGHTDQNGTGGSAGALGDGGASNFSPAIPCDTSDVCSPEGQVCHPAKGICVECLSEDDCEGPALCLRNECRSVVACDTSLACDTSTVCVKEPAAETGYCLECGTNDDCDADEVCAEYECTTACTSDRHCTPQGQLCNLDAGHCVECIESGGGCQAGEYCDAGRCAPMVCSPQSASCVEDSIATCNGEGSGYATLQGCGDYACVTSAGAARCDSPPAPDGALNANGDFSNGGAGWTVEQDGSVQPANPQGGRICVSDGQSLILGWPVEPEDAAQLQGGQAYTLRFHVEVTTSADFPVISVNAKVGAPVSPYTSYGEQNFTDLGAGSHDLSISFTMGEEGGAAGIALQPFAYAGQLCLSEIWLEAS